MTSRRAFLAGGLGWGALMLSGRGAAAVELSSAVEKAMRAAAVPGLSLAVIEDAAVVERRVFGMRGNGAPVAAETRFQAASISKTINALCVLTMVRDGLVGLDDPVNQHLIGWQLGGRKDAGKVTVRMLLSHSGGTSVHGFAGYDQSQTLPGVVDILAGMAPANSAAVEVIAAPGRAFRYSGGGTTVLQKMVMDVTGKRYDVAVNDRVLGPLGMQHSTTQQLASNRGALSSGHDSSGAEVWGSYHRYPEMAAAGLWTTPGDLGLAIGAIIRSLAGEAGALLPQKIAQQMVKPGHGGAGLGTFIDGNGRINHNGVNWGFRATYLASPKRRRGYVIMSNGENGEELNARVATMVMKARGWKSV